MPNNPPLLLPPAPKEIERAMVFTEYAERFGERLDGFNRDFQAATGRFIERAQPFFDALGEALKAIASIRDFLPTPQKTLIRLEQMVAYEIAGRPFGKTIKGMKKWSKKQDENR